MKRKDILRKLEERLARGEINEKTYLEIKARYDSEPEESEAPEATMPDIGEAIGAVVAQATAEASRHAEHAAHVVGEAMRAVDFYGIEASGSLQVDGSIQAEEISSSGSLTVKGRVEVEEFRSSGSVRIDGGLTAEEVEIDLGGTSKIPTIEAEEIRVKATGGFFRVRG